MGIRKTRGFTVIELVVTVAIAAIVLTVAVPSFGQFIVNQRVKDASYDFLSSLNYARSEAIKRNVSVYITSNNGSWKDGWMVTTNVARTFAECQAGATDCLRVYPAIPRVTFAPDTGIAQLAYQRAGRLEGLANRPTFNVCDDKASASVTRRVITIDLSGRPNLSMGSKCNVSA